MKTKELREKTENELNVLLRESRDKLRETRFSLAANQLKNASEISKIKKTIARVLTLLNK